MNRIGIIENIVLGFLFFIFLAAGMARYEKDITKVISSDTKGYYIFRQYS